MPISGSRLTCRKVWQATFLGLLPQIRNYAIPAFRHLRAKDREEAVQETVVQAFVLFVRLMRRGRGEQVFPTTLARFAVARVRQGRTLGTDMNSLDVTSSYAQRRRGFVINRLDHYDPRNRCWIEAAVEDYRTPVVDQVCFRIDFPDWLSRLTRRNRRVAESLAHGNSTHAVARQFRVSAGRVSQLRREFYESWEQFQQGLVTAAERSSRNGCQRPQSASRALRRSGKRNQTLTATA